MESDRCEEVFRCPVLLLCLSHCFLLPLFLYSGVVQPIGLEGANMPSAHFPSGLFGLGCLFSYLIYSRSWRLCCHLVQVKWADSRKPHMSAYNTFESC